MNVLIYLVLLLYNHNVCSHSQAAKRSIIHGRKHKNISKCVFNETLNNDYEILSSAVSESKYIFTARVLSVTKIRRGKPNARINISYKLYIRLVMKGDVRELKSHVFAGDERTLNGGIVFVDWPRHKCAYKLYRHSSGIFLSDGFYESFGRRPRMRLLYEPLPLSLYDLDRVNAALRGKFCSLCYAMLKCTQVINAQCNLQRAHAFPNDGECTHSYRYASNRLLNVL
ncbi:unnamed protein product [Leptosia nina]|uniref:NTR domain-containing protein n=1 Tax=Leptosia nina TaxID=320188 RepID=A0AAV1IS85_9NEOP